MCNRKYNEVNVTKLVKFNELMKSEKKTLLKTTLPLNNIDPNS